MFLKVPFLRTDVPESSVPNNFPLFDDDKHKEPDTFRYSMNYKNHNTCMKDIQRISTTCKNSPLEGTRVPMSSPSNKQLGLDPK